MLLEDAIMMYLDAPTVVGHKLGKAQNVFSSRYCVILAMVNSVMAM